MQQVIPHEAKPVFSFIFKTYLLALLVSVLVVFPPAYIFGAPLPGNETKAVVVRWTWIRLFAEFSYFLLSLPNNVTPLIDC